MGGYGYDQGRQKNTGPLPSGNSGGNPQAVGKIVKAGFDLHSAGVANAANSAAAEAGYQATSAGLGMGAAGTGTAAGSAAASGAAAGVGAGEVAGTVAAKSIVVKALSTLLFYGGETVRDIKANKFHQLKVIGGSEGLKTSNLDKTFYKNVKIPKGKC